jgi:hypothetical protein
MKKLFNRLICFIFDHKWTSKAMKGIKPTETELKSYTGFKHYAKMYCDRCGTESKLNNRL